MSEHKRDWVCVEYGCEICKETKMSSFNSGINDKESAPLKNDSKPIWEMVIEDMKERDSVGEKRYGTRLQKFNGRNSAVDAYQESLDQTVYLRQLVEERKEMVNILKEVLKSTLTEAIEMNIENLLKKLGEIK